GPTQVCALSLSSLHPFMNQQTAHNQPTNTTALRRGVHRYGFNGKEVDSEGMGGGSSTYDYGFRIYNAQLGKFLSVDPLTPEYPMLTPFQFASNTPIVAVDLDGLEAVNHSQVSTQLGNGLISVVEQDDLFYLTHDYHGQLTTVLIEKYGDENEDLKSWFGNYPITRSLYHLGNHHETWTSAAHASGSELDKRYNSEADYCPNSGALGVGNAFRHILGQAAITATYGEGFAKYSGDAHERANGRFGPLDADNIADLLNNEYGRQIGSIWLSAIGGDASKATRENVAGLMNTIAEYVVEATPELAGTDAPHCSEDDDVVTETHRHIVQMAGENE
ncbi:MAG: RHS repeat-associated core domain-containing protein, partial [Flavobacteriales bacterium]